jgi:hypothetical protein
MPKGSRDNKHGREAGGPRWMLGVLAATSVLLMTSAAAAGATPLVIDGVGGVPGKNYYQVVSSEPKDLEGQSFGIVRIGGWECQPLPTGQVYTFISTTGGLFGAFENIPNEGVVSAFFVREPGCSPEEKTPKFRIEYHETGATQTVTATVIDGFPVPRSEVSVSADPSGLVTNEPVTLTATVIASSGTPTGTVEFFNGENNGPIANCLSQPVVQVGPSYEATCQASSLAALIHKRVDPHEDPVGGWAVFEPSAGANLVGSLGRGFWVAQAPTTTTIQSSNATPMVGASVVYTATITPEYLGLIVPSGTIQFLDNEQPIASCENRPLSTDGPSPTATCELSYSLVGTHSITATYAGDRNFLGSTSSLAQAVTVQTAVLVENTTTSSTTTSSSTTTGSEGTITSNESGRSSVAGMTSGSGESHVAAVPPAPGDVLIGSQRVAVRDGRTALVELHCAGTQTCDGTASLAVSRSASKGREERQLTRRMTLGAAHFSIPPGETLTVKVVLTPAGRRLVRAAQTQLDSSLTILCVSHGSSVVRADPVKLVRA